MGSAYQFHSWRVFVIVCALPCVSSVIALTFMPESPRFLLEVMPVVTEARVGPSTPARHLCCFEGSMSASLRGAFSLPATGFCRV